MPFAAASSPQRTRALQPGALSGGRGNAISVWTCSRERRLAREKGLENKQRKDGDCQNEEELVVRQRHRRARIRVPKPKPPDIIPWYVQSTSLVVSSQPRVGLAKRVGRGVGAILNPPVLVLGVRVRARVSVLDRPPCATPE